MKKVISIILSILTVISVFVYSSCSGDNNAQSELTGEELYFSSSDESLALFLNDFYSRHIRNGNDAIGSVKMGMGETYQKLWETDSVVWFDSTANALGSYDAMENIRSWITNITVDRKGYVYSSVTTTQEEGTRAWMGYGWPFPGYSDSNNNGAARSLCYGENFGAGAGGWTVNGAPGTASPLSSSVRYLEFSFNGNTGENLILQSPEIGEGGNGMDTTLFSNAIEFEFLLEDLSDSAGMFSSDVEDLYIEWRTAESRVEHGDDFWFEVSQKDFACAPEAFSSHTMIRAHFPMYLNSDWDGKHVTDVRIVLKPKEGKSLKVQGKMNYFYFMGENCNTVNGGNFIETLEKYVTFNNDIELLQNQITRARCAILYYLEVLNGRNGYTDLSCYRGRALTDGTGYINQNGFWDMYPTGNRNAESDAYFYIALKSLARLERFLSDAGVTVATQEANISYYRNGILETAAYNETAESLDAMAEVVRENICKNVSDGGFWNPDTGRFAWAIYDDNPRIGEKGGAMDYGHTQLNLMLIYYGIPTEEQTAQIFSWLDGERIVDGDNSTGEDIYIYEFAPRSTTKQNNVDHNVMWAITEGNFRWEISCQNGGTCMFISFYDLLARARSKDIENAYDRLKAIENWYEEVAAYEGRGTEFYTQYYLEKYFDDQENPERWTLQGNGVNGAIGIGGEFYESAALYAAIPYMFFGLSASEYNTLSITPDLPNEIGWFVLDNLMYSGIKYSCRIEKNKVIISNVAGNVNNETIKIMLKKSSENPAVTVNGERINSYSQEGDYIVVIIPFGNAEVSVS